MSDDDHAPLAPSAAHRWLHCHASVEAEKGFPDRSSREADEGSAMHEVRARCLRLGRDPMDYEGWVFFGGTRRGTLANVARLRKLEPGIDRIRELCGDEPMAVSDPRYVAIEETLHFEDRALADVYGTLDFGAYFDSGAALSDLKFGAGTPVYAENNEQQLIYADLFLDRLTKAERKRIDRIRIVIDQPRISGAGGEWVIEPDYLVRWRDTVLHPAVAAIQSRGPKKYAPGIKTCQWCKAKRACVAYQDFNLETLGVKFEDERDGKTFNTAGIAEMSIERRAYLAKHKGMLEKFLDGVAESVLEDCLSGAPVPLMKSILGNQGDRVWIDETAARKALEPHLGEKATVTKTISPTVAADLLPRKVMEGFKDLIKRNPAKPKLTTLDDKKPAYVPVKMDDERASDNG